MRIELIVSTYNAPRALALSLYSMLHQSVRPDAVCVADDGSGEETQAVIAQFQAQAPFPIRHVWHEDQGFRKTVILNKAVTCSKADLLVFTDGDCLLSPGFVARHRAVADRRRFASGSLVRLNDTATQAVTPDLIENGDVFSRPWLKRYDTFDRATTWLKTMPLPQMVQSGIDAIYPIRRTWMGSNASAFREAILSVNGFDETMVWGGEDKEFGVRLANSGVRGRQLRFTSLAVHLNHPRGYRDEEAVRKQREMIQMARRTGKTWTETGIQKRPV